MRFGLVFIFCAIFCARSSFAESFSDPSPRFLVHLVDYLAKDYDGAVQSGKIISESEYQEQRDFIASALETNAHLELNKTHPEIQKNLQALKKLIDAKSSSEDVRRKARQIEEQIIQASQLAAIPENWPNLRHGKQLFQQNCVSCHGVSGLGDGPVGEALHPRPANFHAAEMNEVSPFQAFNTIRLGVPGTGMDPFNVLSDQEVWDLAFYVVSLRYATTPPLTNFSPDHSMLKQVALSSDRHLQELFADQQDAIPFIASLRLYSTNEGPTTPELGAAQQKLDEAFTAYQNGKFAVAKTTALQAYLEYIEPIEPRLKVIDANALIELESKMAAVPSSIASRIPVDELAQVTASAQSQIDRTEQLFRESTTAFAKAFVSSMTTLLGKSFEAVLILIALLCLFPVNFGWAFALAFSLLLSLPIGGLSFFGGSTQELIYADLAVVVALMLIGTRYWLRVRPAAAQKYFSLLSFLAVFRGTFQTALFLRNLWMENISAVRIPMTLGALALCGLALLSVWILTKVFARFPQARLAPTLHSLMIFIAILLSGKGIHSFQKMEWLPATKFPYPLRIPLLGLYPTWQSLGVQTAVLLVAVIFGRRHGSHVKRNG